MSTKKKAAPKAKTLKTPASQAARVKRGAKPKQFSAIDAATKVLAESTEPMTTKQLIEAMTSKGLWTSPGGKTPERTLYSEILREINTKGKDARFVKTERGKFTTKK